MDGFEERPPRETLGEVVVDGRSWPVEIDRPARRFEIRVDGEAAILTYDIRGTALLLTHTEVPMALRGKGLGEALAQASLEYARRLDMTVEPYCPFVARYIERNPVYAELVDPGFRPR